MAGVASTAQPWQLCLSLQLSAAWHNPEPACQTATRIAACIAARCQRTHAKPLATPQTSRPHHHPFQRHRSLLVLLLVQHHLHHPSAVLAADACEAALLLHLHRHPAGNNKVTATLLRRPYLALASEDVEVGCPSAWLGAQHPQVWRKTLNFYFAG